MPPHTHSFNGPLSRTTQVSRYQKAADTDRAMPGCDAHLPFPCLEPAFLTRLGIDIVLVCLSGFLILCFSVVAWIARFLCRLIFRRVGFSFSVLGTMPVPDNLFRD